MKRLTPLRFTLAMLIEVSEPWPLAMDFSTDVELLKLAERAANSTHNPEAAVRFVMGPDYYEALD